MTGRHQTGTGHLIPAEDTAATKLDFKPGQADILVGAENDQAIADCGKRFASLSQLPDAARQTLIDMMFDSGLFRFNRQNWPNLIRAVAGLSRTKTNAH